jgi:hypothetical protein
MSKRYNIELLLSLPQEAQNEIGFILSGLISLADYEGALDEHLAPFREVEQALYVGRKL